MKEVIVVPKHQISCKDTTFLWHLQEKSLIFDRKEQIYLLICQFFCNFAPSLDNCTQMANELTIYNPNDESVVVYRSEDNTLQLDVQLAEDTVWLTQQQMAELFATSKPNISIHISNILKEKELNRESVVKDYLTTATDGKTTWRSSITSMPSSAWGRITAEEAKEHTETEFEKYRIVQDRLFQSDLTDSLENYQT